MQGITICWRNKNVIKEKTSVTWLYGSGTQGWQHKHNSELNNPQRYHRSDVTEFQLQSVIAGMTDGKRWWELWAKNIYPDINIHLALLVYLPESTFFVVTVALGIRSANISLRNHVTTQEFFISKIIPGYVDASINLLFNISFFIQPQLGVMKRRKRRFS